MAELIDDIFAAYIADAEESGGGFDPAALRPALVALRKGYHGDRPTFATASARAAYSLAYHPYHAHLMLEVLRRMADVMTFEHKVVRTTVFGAGPGPEVCALAKFLGEAHPEVRRLEVNLVDAEPGWTETRMRTLVRSVPQWWDGELVLAHHVLDLTRADDIETALRVASGSELIVAQAVFSELVMKGGRVSFLNRLFSVFGPTTLLLVTDFHKMDEFQSINEELGTHGDAKALRSTQVRLPLPLAPPVLRDLYAKANGLWQRRSVKADARAYVRPGWRPPLPASSSERPEPRGDQIQAIAGLRRFVDERTNDVFVLSGPAGSGKTMVIGEIAQHARAAGRIVSICAPTGQAARRLAARTGLPSQTIHSALYSDPDEEDRGDEKVPLTRFQSTFVGGPSQLMIVDESSLVGDEKVENTDDTDVLFGDGCLLSDILTGVVGQGGQVVFVGDRHQLAPVGSDTLPALDVAGLRGRGFRVAEGALTEVHRQKEGSEILDLAAGCRASVASAAPLPPLPSAAGGAVQQLDSSVPEWLLAAAWRGDAMVVASRHSDAEKWIGKIRRHAGVAASQPVAGDRLVLVRGASSSGLLNGDELTVVEHLGTEVVRHVRDPSRAVTLHQLVLESVTPLGTTTRFVAYVVGELLMQAPQVRIREVTEVLFVDFVVRMRKNGVERRSPEFSQQMRDDARMGALYCMYSYARTAHRAQGGEWDVVVCDLTKTHQRGVPLARYAYTAVTRGRRTLWVSSWPTRPLQDSTAAFDRYVAEARRWLEEAGTGPLSTSAASAGNGVTVRRMPDDKSLVVNLYRSFTYQVQKWPASLGPRDAFEAKLAGWKVLAAPPRELDEMARVWLGPRLDALERRGIEVDLDQTGAYQVVLTARRAGAEARFEVTHKATGACTVRHHAGDIDLIEAVTRELGDAR